MRPDAPFRQGQALHRAENALLEVGIGLRQRGDQLLDLLPLRVFVGGAAVFDHGELLLRGKAAHHPFGQVEHRADLRHAHAVEIGHGLEAAQPSLKDQAHQERLHRIVVVVAEGDLGKALLRQGFIQCPAAHLRAHRAGIFLLAIVKNDRPDLRLHLRERHVQLFAQRRDGRKVHPKPHVDRDRRQLKRLRIVFAQRRQQRQERQRVLPARHAHGDFIVRRDHAVVVRAAPHQSHQSLHRLPPFPAAFSTENGFLPRENQRE